MIIHLLIFIIAISGLIFSARLFTKSAEIIGAFFNFPPFVIGIFIVGIGTSLPELISGIISVNKGVSEILSGNIIGSNISNILLITGIVAVANKKTITLNSNYLYIDLHFLLGSLLYFLMIAYDGKISFTEAFIGFVIFIIYSFYLIKGESQKNDESAENIVKVFPLKSLGLLIISCLGIYFGADFTISSLEQIALGFGIPNAIIALTLLSLGTTLPELVVNISAIKQGKAEMAIGNILGSCIFNTLVIPSIVSGIGIINVPANLLEFSLPLMAACGLLFYLLTQDKKISTWEGLMFICIYLLFIIKTGFGI